MNARIAFAVFSLVGALSVRAETVVESEEALTRDLPSLFSRAAAHYRELDAAATPLMRDTKGELRTPHGFDRQARTLDMRSIYWWTSGHYPGSLWYLYEATGDDFFKARATAWTEILEPVSEYVDNHDVGFMMYCSYGNARRLLKTDRYDAILVKTAETLCRRYNERIGLIRSWGRIDAKYNFEVIPDNLMNLELLEWAATCGAAGVRALPKGDGLCSSADFDAVARSHADVTMKYHFRPDGGCYHVLNYDQQTGRPKAYLPGQGASVTSAWSRGQGWAIYGYTMMYRMTQEKRYLDFARKCADFAIGHANMPTDGIPYWDFGRPGEERDSSAAAIMASGLLELSQYAGADGARYRAFAVKQLVRLASPDYFSQGDEIGHFLLKHGVGHKPAGKEIDTPLDYGDYYFLEALLRFRRLCQPHGHVSLDGAWEMAYSPYDRESREYPVFKGVRIENAVPGYWEDMVGAFRAAGMTDAFRINPKFKVQRPPFRGYAMDTTLPDIRGTFFYRRMVSLDRVAPATLSFEGVRNNIQVWVNGAYVATHRGYSAPFALAVPPDALKRGENEIVFAVCNGPVLGYCDYVSGLTSRGLFASTGGVNGHVELRFDDEIPPDVHGTTPADCKAFTLHAAGNDGVRYVIRDGTRVLASGEMKGETTLSADGYALWTPENPKLYDLEVRSASGAIARQRFGIRRLTAKGEKLFLNGEPVYLRGVTEHCYFAKTVHLPRDLGYYRMITAKRKALGFNFVRFHTFVPPVEYLQATDELGMLVHIESPNFTSEAEYAEIIDFARTHPSVVIYCTGNETRIDRLAERYLADIAEMVHARTDALFTPMSALRGVEYCLMDGLDPVVKTPYLHNAERMARISPFCDLFTSYANAMVSYESLNSGTPAELDRRGDAFLGRPRLSHEICIDSSYADFSLEKLYPPDSPIVKTGVFSGVRENLRARGLLDRADVYFRHSCEWMRRVRKHCFEKLRAADRISGYDFLGDINTHWHTFGYSVGMMDEFYRLKPGETIENVLRYNGAAVLLSDLGSDFNVTAGQAKSVRFSVSNYAKCIVGAKLSVRLVEADGDRCVWEKTVGCGTIPVGGLTSLAAADVAVPSSPYAKKYLLKASVAGLADNEWELYAFPKAESVVVQENLRVVTDISKTDLLAAMARGERVLLLGAGPFKSLKTSFRIGMAGRTIGNYATVIKDHSVFANFPHEGYCGWQFRRLLEDGAAVQLEAGVPFDPIVDIASSVKFPIRQAMMFEYRVGKGRLLVCSFNLSKDDPAAVVLRNALVIYAAGERFDPLQVLTPAQLTAVLDAPLLCGERDANRANNVNDPSSLVRAEEWAQP